MQADKGTLKPVAGDTREGSALEVNAITKTVGSSMAQLLSAASQSNENHTGIAARDTCMLIAVPAYN